MEQEKKQKKGLSKQAKKYIFNIALIVLVTGLTLFFVLKDNFFDVIDLIKSAVVWPIVVMFALTFASFILDGLVLWVLAKMYQKKYKVYQGFCNGLIGSFFSGITPFASGGQFAQVYTFSKQGVKVAHGASILVMNFIIYQICITIAGVLAFIVGFDVISKMESFKIFGLSLSPIVLSIIGFAINSFTLALLFLLSYSKKIHKWALNGGINILAKLKFIKNPEKKRVAWSAQVASFRVELKRLLTNGWVLLIVTGLMLFKLAVWYSIPYFAGLSLRANMEGKYFDTLISTAFLSMITSFVPLPGASGGAEAFFQIMFNSIFIDNKITSSANILWRGTTYYASLLIGGLTTLFYRASPKQGVTNVEASTKTFVDLQIVSLEERTKTLDKIPEIMSPLSIEDVQNSFNNIKKDLNKNDELIEDVDSMEDKFKTTSEFKALKKDEKGNDK